MGLSVDDLGSPAVHTDTPEPTWDQVEAAIRLLDQHSHTEVTLAIDYEDYLSVSGGIGEYFVFIWRNDENLQPFRKSEPDEDATLVCGGQRIMMNRRYLVGLDAAIDIARQYCGSGEPWPGLAWRTT